MWLRGQEEGDNDSNDGDDGRISRDGCALFPREN